MTRSTRSSRRRILALVPAAALVVTGLAAGATSGSATAAPASPGTHGSAGAIDASYINYVAPEVENPTKDGKVSKKTLDEAKKPRREVQLGQPGGRPCSSPRLSAGRSDRHQPGQFQAGKAKDQQTAQAAHASSSSSTTHANDDFSGVSVPKTVFGDRTCVDRARRHDAERAAAQQHPEPGRLSDGRHEDNNSFWVPDFSPEHFNKMLYTKQGITERVRPDLTGPDGKPGIDISGYTMRNMYEEMSKGAYTVTGAGDAVDHGAALRGAGTARPLP